MRFAIMFLLVVIWIVPEFYPIAYLLYALFDCFSGCKAAVFCRNDKMIDKINALWDERI